MKLILILSLLLSGCASTRVLVKDDCDKAGPGLLNCELVKEL